MYYDSGRDTGVSRPADEAYVSRDFTFRDGERVIRFGPGVLGEALGLIEAQGLNDYALMTTGRARKEAPAPVTNGAATVLHVPAGPVPEAAATIRDGIEGRPLVALGGGRVVDAAKAIAATDGLSVAAIPTTLAGSSSDARAAVIATASIRSARSSITNSSTAHRKSSRVVTGGPSPGADLRETREPLRTERT